jgi:signal transduction histidine kinase
VVRRGAPEGPNRGSMRRETVLSIVHGMSEDRATARPFPAAPDPARADPEADPAGLRRTRGEHQLVQGWLPVLRSVVVPVVVLYAVLAHPGPGTSGRGLVVSAGIALVVAGFAVAVRSIARQTARASAAFGGAIVVAGSGMLMWAQPDGPGAPSALLGVLLIARLLPARAAFAATAAACAVLATISEITAHGHGPGVALLVALAGLAGMVVLAGRLREANDQAERLLAELEASRAAEARAAGLAERQRLAREMHDVLAHSLSGLVVKLEGARMLAARSPDDPRIPDAVDEAHRLAKSGLEDARRAISALRGEQMPGPDRLPALAARFGTDLGVPCRLTVSGTERQLGAEARLAVYRVAQEALTTIAKHARPERVELRLAYEPDATRLTVEDFTATGSAAANPATPPSGNGNGNGNGGYGLAGMRERAELIGGTLSAGTTPTGFRVELEVPA